MADDYGRFQRGDISSEFENLKQQSDSFKEVLREIGRLEAEGLTRSDEKLKEQYRKKWELEEQFQAQAQQNVEDDWRKFFKKKSLQERIELQRQAKQQHKEALANLKKLNKKEIEEAKTEQEKEAARSRARSRVAEERLAYEKISTPTYTGKDVGASIIKRLDAAITKMTGKVDSALEEITSYQAKIEARLQGSGKSFSAIEKSVATSVAASPFVKQRELYQNISTLIDKGVAFNIEERAFLQTMADKIVTTFDAFDENLLRLIRLQQADITASRMGMEANLTQVLNTMFHDTSYLSDVYDTVSGAILEANSLLSAKASTSFEYNVQKWLGSLYSLGFSGDAIASIAQGINYLATGNVASLTGNQALSSLFALSAGRGGLDYAEALRNGLDAAGVNDLMKGMIAYLQEVARNTDSKITLSAYANLFGMSVADLKAISSITQKELDSLLKTNMDYETSLNELSKQFSTVPKRMTMAQKIANVADNIVYTSASQLASTPWAYAAWVLTSAIEEATGGTKIPSPFVLGSGVDLSSFTVEGIVKAGLGIGGMLSKIGAITSSIGTFNRGMAYNPFEDVWRFETERGTEFTGLFSGVEQGISKSTRYVTAANVADMTRTSLEQVAEEAGEVAKVTGTQGAEKTFDDLYDAMFTSGEQKTIRVSLDDEAIKKLIIGIYTGGKKDSGEINDTIEEFLNRIAINNPISVTSYYDPSETILSGLGKS